MSSRQITNSRFAGRLPGLLLAVIALVSQLALGMVVLPDDGFARDQSVAALKALTVLCDSAVPATPGQQPGHHRHAPDTALCPLSVALAVPAMVLAAAPELPAPPSHVAGRAGLPAAARGPPEQPRDTPPPRGPPALA